MPEVRLRPMTAAEFAAFHTRAIADYAQDAIDNMAVGSHVARQHAERQVAALLPLGLDTSGHRLYAAEDVSNGDRVGWLWWALRDHGLGQIAWLFDLYVEPECRGRGYGRALMKAWEEDVRLAGLRRLELNVFGNNSVARGLYESLGFVETARQMRMDL